MSRAIESYERAYSTNDLSEIPRLVESAFAPDVLFESPYVDTPIHGRDALIDHIEATRDRIEGVSSRRTSVLERVGHTIRWTWAFEADGEVVAEGMDFAVLDSSGRIERLVVFDGVVPAEP